MSTKAVIFDLDGTLLDTLNDLAVAANMALERHDYPGHPVDDYRWFVGEGLVTLVKRILPEPATDLMVEQVMKSFQDIYVNSWALTSKPYDGVISMLEQLVEKDLKLAVLSNKPHPFTKLCVDHFFAKDLFDKVYGQRPGVPKKPDPGGALDIADKLGLPARDIVYIGDSSTDMKTGNAAGMTTLGVLWGFRTREELEEHNASHIVTTPQEIVEYVIHSG